MSVVRTAFAGWIDVIHSLTHFAIALHTTVHLHITGQYRSCMLGCHDKLASLHARHPRRSPVRRMLISFWYSLSASVSTVYTYSSIPAHRELFNERPRTTGAVRFDQIPGVAVKPQQVVVAPARVQHAAQPVDGLEGAHALIQRSFVGRIAPPPATPVQTHRTVPTLDAYVT